MFRIPYLVLCLVAVSHQFTVSKFDVPEAVEVSGNATLFCEHDARAPRYAKWWWEAPGRARREQLYQRLDDAAPSVSHRNKLDLNITYNPESVDSIQIWDLKPAHSGTFICEVVENEVTEVRNSGDLVVYSIGSGPLLNMSKSPESELVLVTCEALDAAPAPAVAIQLDSVTLNATSEVARGAGGLFRARAAAAVPEAALRGAAVSCRLAFQDVDVTASVSDTYYSDAWPATTAAPDEAPEAQGSLEAPTPLPGGGGRARASWRLLAALAPALLALL